MGMVERKKMESKVTKEEVVPLEAVTREMKILTRKQHLHSRQKFPWTMSRWSVP